MLLLKFIGKLTYYYYNVGKTCSAEAEISKTLGKSCNKTKYFARSKNLLIEL